jgi:cell division septation protein DedD
MSDVQDSEITLGTGRLLGLFFGLVILCALFFSVGFSLGRKANTTQTAVASTLSVPPATSSAPKPSPSRAESKADCATPDNCPPTASTSDELTFYKAVEQNEPKAKLEPAATPPPPSRPERAARATASGYLVQVAAVTKQEDADALVNALRRKNYRVAASNGAGDKLYHVQVGPFPDLKDAEAARTKLISDGYNPIVKK